MARGGRKDLGDLFEEFTDSIFIWLGLIVAVGVGIWIVSWIRSRFADDEGSATEDHRLLSQIGDLREQGDLTEEEYRSIKGRLVVRLDDSMSANGEKRTAHPASESGENPPSPTPEANEGDPKTRDASNG